MSWPKTGTVGSVAKGLAERILFNILKRLNVDPLTGRLRVASESTVITSGTVTTVTTAGTIGSTAIGIIAGIGFSQMQSQISYQQGFRNNLAII